MMLSEQSCNLASCWGEIQFWGSSWLLSFLAGICCLSCHGSCCLSWLFCRWAFWRRQNRLSTTRNNMDH